MVIGEILNSAIHALAENGVDSPRSSAEQLLGWSLGLTRTDVYRNFDHPLSAREVTSFEASLQRRLIREPLQYIVGETEFMSLPFKVNPDVLIPRPETEVLVETVIEKCQEAFSPGRMIRLLEIGTGSGCIAISLAKYLPSVRVLALEISERALALASENAVRNDVAERVELQFGDLEDNSISKFPAGEFDGLVSNPPYIRVRDWNRLQPEVREFEPAIALTAGADGLRFYRRIAAVAPLFLRPNGFVALEMGFGQVRQIKRLFTRKEFSHTRTVTDLNDIERVVLFENVPVSQREINCREVA